MPQDVVWKITFREQEAFHLVDRPAGDDETVETLSTISGYKLQVFDSTEGDAQAFSEESGSIGTSEPYTGTLLMYGSPQKDDRWTRDETGFTALWRLDPRLWTTPAIGGHKYLLRLEYQTSPSENRPNPEVITRVSAVCKFDRATT